MQAVLLHALADRSGRDDADLREFFTVMYGPVVSFVFPDVLVKAYRNSVLYVNLVSVVDCSVLNWVEQKELRGLASDDRLFGRIAVPGCVFMGFNNNAEWSVRIFPVSSSIRSFGTCDQW